MSKLPKTTSVMQHGVQCLDCKDKLFSNYRHDFRQCSCGAVFIDGGHATENPKVWGYERVGFTHNSNYKHIKRKHKAFVTVRLSDG